jgi:hypothetical protein
VQLKDDDDLEEVNVIFFALSKLLRMKVADECHFCHHTFSTFHWRERDSAPPQATGTLASAAFNLPTNRAAVACLTRVKRVFSSGDMEWGIGVSSFPSYTTSFSRPPIVSARAKGVIFAFFLWPPPTATTMAHWHRSAPQHDPLNSITHSTEIGTVRNEIFTNSSIVHCGIKHKT